MEQTPKMDDFEASNKMLDAIDGILSPKMARAFEAHLAESEESRDRLTRLRELLSVLHSQPRATMPLDLRERPLSFPIWRLRRFFANPRAVWKQLPVAARLLIEGVSIAAVVVVGIKLGPVARDLYERRMEQRLQTMIAAEDLSSGNVPMARGIQSDSEVSDEVGNSEGGENETEVDTSAGVDVDSDVQVGRGEIWRFNLKTDAPALVRNQILKALREAGLPETTPGIGGVEAPGGIQFDLIVPQALIPSLKVTLEKLAGTPSENLPFSETFTWYKNRSKKPIPNGTSRMVIWLSQI
ncbi:MAG: hypothetical protein H7301_10830 [Cryobacterium sp.]|nr:hypothetical protein [Oligoflexia bacterium]